MNTLAERLTPGALTNLMAQLPDVIDLREEATGSPVESFGRDEFLRRISGREGVDLPAATFHARAVIEVVDEATQGVVPKVREQLPDEFTPLFEAGSQGQMTT